YQLIGGLSRREQQLIALKYGAEQTNRKIAHILDMSESNVGTSLQRIIHKLRARWNGVWLRADRKEETS
ncbi:MAG: sigma-70 family RNA polymerase sigma factor, partial [Anaerolineaceae bacterium]